MRKLLVILILTASSLAVRYPCNYRSALLTLKKSTYNFSVKLLDRVCQESDGNFVFSPISTWLQLVSLAEGAEGKTLKEIWTVTKHHRLKCFRRKWRMIFNRIDKQIEDVPLRRSFMVIDSLMAVKKPFVREVQRLKSMKVLLLDFSYSKAADIANEQVSKATNGVIDEVFTPHDFDSTVLLTADILSYKSAWNVPFNPVYTSREHFYNKYGDREEVMMMNRIDYFNVTEIAAIRAKVLELPCGEHERVSMLIFLPTGDSVVDLFYLLPRIRLASIFNKFKKEKTKLVNLKLPRFNLTTDIDNIPELLSDMGLKRVFYPDLANLKGVSAYKVYASLMTQVSRVEVTEAGVSATAVASYLLADKVTEEFAVNKPFAFMLVDRKSELILFAGMYSGQAN